MNRVNLLGFVVDEPGPPTEAGTGFIRLKTIDKHCPDLVHLVLLPEKIFSILQRRGSMRGKTMLVEGKLQDIGKGPYVYAQLAYLVS